MINDNRTRAGFRQLVILSLVLFILFSIMGIGGGGRAYADTSIKKYTTVLSDLEKDEGFNLSDYPEDNKDTGMYIKQIAEGTGGELFIYVYQPAVAYKLTAIYINMALSEELTNEDTSYTPTGEEFERLCGGFGGETGGGFGGGGGGGRMARASAYAEGGRTDLYNLVLLSRQSVFAKYRVSGLILSKDTKRFYNITAIYRNFNSEIDKEADNDNTIGGVACKVGQLWTATTDGDGVKYEAKDIEVVKLTSQMIGMHRYNDGFQFDGTKSLDSHYIAFKCDHKIDKLLSADLEFSTRTFKTLAGSGTTYGGRVPHRVSLYDYQVVSNDGGGWFGKKEEWHRMTSVKNFVKEVDLSTEEKEALSDYDWILNFYESEFTNEAGGKDVLISGLLPFGFIWTIVNACTTTGELVFDVSLLRLEFKYAGKIYNLGVVSDIQTGTNKPIGSSGFDLWEWMSEKLNIPVWACKTIVYGGIALIVLAILLPVLSAIFPAFRSAMIEIGRALRWVLKGIGYCFKCLIMGLWYVISAPFKLIALAVRSGRERREQKPAAPKKTATRKPKQPAATLGKGKPVKRTKPKQGGKK